MGDLKGIAEILSDVAEELSSYGRGLSFTDFLLLDDAKDKLTMAGAAVIARQKAEMTEEERELVKKLIDTCKLYISFIEEKKGD